VQTITRVPWLAAVVLAAFAAAVPADARSLRDQLGQASQSVGLQGGNAFDALADTIADTAARSLPVISASAGITYRYNTELDVFERSSDTLGPIFMERPDTIGRSKFNVNVSYQYVQFDEYDGQDLDSLQNRDPIITRVVDGSGNPVGFTANRLQYRLGLQNQIVAFSGTYGLLDDLDVNLTLPLIATNFKVGVTQQQEFAAGPDGIFTPLTLAPVTARSTEDKFSVGDMLLRFKYQLPRIADGWLRSAAGLQLRLPTGNEDDFQGTGSFEISPAFYVSTVLWKRVTPYVNAAIDLRTDDVANSQARYAVGFDFDLFPRWNLSFAFLGRSEFERSAKAGETDFLHLTPQGPALRPLLGLDFARNDFFDASFGTRVVVWRQIMLFGNILYALNDAGLRNNSVIPTVGIEGTF
jgi:hypothetical protein